MSDPLRAEALAVLEGWLKDSPRLVGGDPEAEHYQQVVRVLETAIAALSAQVPEDDAGEALAELRRIVTLDDEANTKHGGLADCTDNNGDPYQSQALANCLSRARALIEAADRIEGLVGKKA